MKADQEQLFVEHLVQANAHALLALHALALANKEDRPVVVLLDLDDAHARDLFEAMPVAGANAEAVAAPLRPHGTPTVFFSLSSREACAAVCPISPGTAERVQAKPTLPGYVLVLAVAAGSAWIFWLARDCETN